MGLIALLRQQLKKGDDWVDRHKEIAMEQPHLVIDGRGKEFIKGTVCPNCKHDKARKKNKYLKCTKCGCKF